jgi:hypothetical protein
MAARVSRDGTGHWCRCFFTNVLRSCSDRRGEYMGVAAHLRATARRTGIFYIEAEERWIWWKR